MCTGIESDCEATAGFCDARTSCSSVSDSLALTVPASSRLADSVPSNHRRVLTQCVEIHNTPRNQRDRIVNASSMFVHLRQLQCPSAQLFCSAPRACRSKYSARLGCAPAAGHSGVGQHFGFCKSHDTSHRDVPYACGHMDEDWIHRLAPACSAEATQSWNDAARDISLDVCCRYMCR